MDPKFKNGKTLNQTLVRIGQSEHNNAEEKLIMHAGSQCNPGDWLWFLMAVPMSKNELNAVKSHYVCNEKYCAVPANGNAMNNSGFLLHVIADFSHLHDKNKSVVDRLMILITMLNLAKIEIKSLNLQKHQSMI